MTHGVDPAIEKWLADREAEIETMLELDLWTEAIETCARNGAPDGASGIRFRARGLLVGLDGFLEAFTRAIITDWLKDTMPVINGSPADRKRFEIALWTHLRVSFSEAVYARVDQMSEEPRPAGSA